MSAWVVWAGFLGCLLLILYSGSQLSRYGDLIALRTGLGGTWVGVVLVAGVTSLPELVTGLSSVVVVSAPDLAVGDALGSCIYNLSIIVILDLVYQQESIYTRAHQGHVLSAGFGVVLLGVVAGGIVLQRQFEGLAVGHVGYYALALPLLYAVAMRSVFQYERRERKAYIEEVVEAIEGRSPEAKEMPLSAIYLRYAGNAAVVMAAGGLLPVIGSALARIMGWDDTFVGTILLALATSVPEIVISLEAVRIGSMDLAIGNLLGSNLFDVLIIAIDDFAYLDGPLLAAASGEHLFTALTAVTMTGVVVVGLFYRPRRRVFHLVGWTSLALLVLGLLNALVLFLIR